MGETQLHYMLAMLASKAYLQKMLKKITHAIDEDWYFSYSRTIWTNDPEYEVVQLRDRIIQLVEDNLSEVTGTTAHEEMYTLAPGDGRYALARVRGGEIIEGTYFEWGWPRGKGNQSDPVVIVPRLLEIRGNPYRITKGEGPQRSQIALKVEN